MISTLTVPFRRAKQVFQTEGLMPLLRRAFAFMIGRLFRHETYYLYEYATEDIAKLNEADFMPKVDNFTFKIISTNQQADELEADGLEFRSQVINGRERLDKGAIAFCFFVGQELAHIDWVAVTEEAKDGLNELPYKVDFSNHEVCHGSLWTNPKYRGRGLAVYGGVKIFQFLRERGKVADRAPIARDNIASQRAYAKLGPKRYAEARYLKILWWKSWKEKPLT